MKPEVMTRTEFDALFRSVSNWGRWGADDERGTLNFLMPRYTVAAAGLVKTGRTISMAIPLNTVAGPDNPHPVVHTMIRYHDEPTTECEPSFATDRITTESHGDCFTHIDALCHVSYSGRLYNGRSDEQITSHGSLQQDITTYAHGIVGRGVLLDLPRLHGVQWLEPGEAVTVEELEAAEQAQGVRIGEGDILCFRTGHHARRLALGAWDCGYSGQGRAGLHATTAAWMRERKIAAFFPDGDGETVPSRVVGVAYPLHALQIASMGMVCADSLQFEELRVACEEENRWEFLVAASPLRLPKGTGTLFNPLAIL